MRQSSLLFLAVMVVQAYSAPQFITFNDGKLGVNFGGYHAAVGLGGQAGKGGTAGGLFAEAGTPFGPAARAGLGGVVDGNNGGTSGGLYAGATAGGNVNAAAGLGGSVGAGKAVGAGYSTAQAGGKTSISALGGDVDDAGSSGFSISAHKSINVPTTVVKHTEVSVVPIEEIKTIHKKVDTEAKFEAANEITPVGNADIEAHGNLNINSQSTGFVKEVNVPVSQSEVIVHKHKPHRHHVHKTAYIGGYIGAGADVNAPVEKTITLNTAHPVNKQVEIEKEVDISGAHTGKVTTFTKEVVVGNRPSTFFQDIFNIPISTLKAVSGFLSNTAANTNVSVQKSASVHAGGYGNFNGGYKHSGYSTDTDALTSKHVPLSSSSSSSEAHISVKTPNASSFIDDIFSIPINTLSAVNKFLENNVGARKRVQVSEGPGEPTRVRLGPHARRRANKHVVIVQEPAAPQHTSEESVQQ